MLKHIEAEDVTFKQEYRRTGSISMYRLWSSETEYVPVTRCVKRLVGLKLAKETHGWQHGRGAVEITPLGRKALR